MWCCNAKTKQLFMLILFDGWFAVVAMRFFFIITCTTSANMLILKHLAEKPVVWHNPFVYHVRHALSKIIWCTTKTYIVKAQNCDHSTSTKTWVLSESTFSLAQRALIPKPTYLSMPGLLLTRILLFIAVGRETALNSSQVFYAV